MAPPSYVPDSGSADDVDLGQFDFSGIEITAPQAAQPIPEAVIQATFAQWANEGLEVPPAQQVEGYHFDDPGLLQQPGPNNNFWAPMPAGNFAPGPWRCPALQAPGGYLTPPNSGTAGPLFPPPGAAIPQAAPLLPPAASAPHGATHPRVPSPPASPPAARGTASGRVQKKKKPKAKASSRPAASGQLTWHVDCPGEDFVPTPYQSNSFSKAARAMTSQKD